MHRYDYLIVGGGMAADAAARGIREVDGSGTIGIVASEPDPPYSRPPLSKALWKGEPERSIWRDTASAGVTMHLGRVATTLDRSSRRVTDHAGQAYEYGSLLLATGGTPRVFPFAADGVIYYRTFQDYRALRELADHGQRFAVIGGGFIGSEVAAALRMAGKDVVMVVPEAGIGARVFPADVSRHVLEYYRANGVDVRAEHRVLAIERRGSRFTVRLDGGESVFVDGIVAGLGIVPNVTLAQSFGATAAEGIAVDERLRAIGGVFAAGDVARFCNKALGSALRVEHEDNALTMGKAAGRSMAGDDTPYDHLPFFYSDLFELGYEAVGILDSRLETVADWTEPYRKGVVYYLADHRVHGVLLWNVWGQVEAARALIAEAGPHGPDTLKGRITG